MSVSSPIQEFISSRLHSLVFPTWLSEDTCVIKKRGRGDPSTYIPRTAIPGEKYSANVPQANDFARKVPQYTIPYSRSPTSFPSLLKILFRRLSLLRHRRFPQNHSFSIHLSASADNTKSGSIPTIWQGTTPTNLLSSNDRCFIVSIVFEPATKLSSPQVNTVRLKTYHLPIFVT